MDSVTVGETMAVFVAATEGRMGYSPSFDRYIGGAESNYAIALARLGFESGWIGRVGEDEFGDAVVRELRAEGVDVRGVTRDKRRPTGLLFKERRQGLDPGVAYYRRGSAGSALREEHVDFDYLLSSRSVHVTGILFAISTNCGRLGRLILERARSNGSLVSFDVNVRLRLHPRQWWRRAILPLIDHVDVLTLTLQEATLLTGLEAPGQAALRLLRMGPKAVAVKDGATGSTIATADRVVFVEAEYVPHVVSPHGAGDAYAAGLTAGILRGYDIVDAARLASRLGATATTAVGFPAALPDSRTRTEEYGR